MAVGSRERTEVCLCTVRRRADWYLLGRRVRRTELAQFSSCLRSEHDGIVIKNASSGQKWLSTLQVMLQTYDREGNVHNCSKKWLILSLLKDTRISKSIKHFGFKSNIHDVAESTPKIRVFFHMLPSSGANYVTRSYMKIPSFTEFHDVPITVPQPQTRASRDQVRTVPPDNVDTSVYSDASVSTIEDSHKEPTLTTTTSATIELENEEQANKVEKAVDNVDSNQLVIATKTFSNGQHSDELYLLQVDVYELEAKVKDAISQITDIEASSQSDLLNTVNKLEDMDQYFIELVQLALKLKTKCKETNWFTSENGRETAFDNEEYNNGSTFDEHDLTEMEDRLSTALLRCTEAHDKCLTLRAHLGTVQDNDVAIATRLEDIHNELAQLSNQLDSSSASLSGGNLVQGLDWQLNHLASLILHVTGYLQPALHSLFKTQTASAPICDAVSEAQAELEDILLALTTRQTGLLQLSKDIASLQADVSTQLNNVKTLGDKLQQVAVTEMVQTADCVDNKLQDFWAKVDQVRLLESTVNRILDELHSFTQHSAATLSQKYCLPGGLDNTDMFLQLEATLRSSWNCLQADILPCAMNNLIEAAANVAQQMCQPAILFCETSTVNTMDFIIQPDRISEQISLIATHLETLHQVRNWINNIVDDYLTNQSDICDFRTTSWVGSSGPHLLPYIEQTRRKLSHMTHQITTVFAPISKAWNHRVLSSTTFLDLLRMQVKELHSTLNELFKPMIQPDAFGREVNSADWFEDSPITRVQVVYVHKKRCQQLVSALHEERTLLREELFAILSPLFHDNKPSTTSETGEATHLCGSPSQIVDSSYSIFESEVCVTDAAFAPNEEAVSLIAQVLADYDTLADDLEQCHLQLDTISDALTSALGDDVNEPVEDTVTNVELQNGVSDNGWDTDSGIPLDPLIFPSPSCTDELGQFVYSNGDNARQAASDPTSTSTMKPVSNANGQLMHGAGTEYDDRETSCMEDESHTVIPVENGTRMNVRLTLLPNDVNLRLCRLKELEKRIRCLQVDYRGLIHSLLTDLVNLIGSACNDDILQSSVVIVKEKQTKIKEYINRLPDVSPLRSGDSAAETQPLTNVAARVGSGQSAAIAEAPATPCSFNPVAEIRLAYQQGYLDSAFGYLDESMNLQNSRLLTLYELLVRVDATHTRFADWFNSFKMKLNGKLSNLDAGSSDFLALSSHVNRLEVLQIELYAKCELLGSLTYDCSSACNILEAVERDLTTLDMLLPGVDTPQPEELTNSSALHSHLLNLPTELEATCFSLVRDIAEQLTICRTHLFNTDKLEVSVETLEKMLTNIPEQEMKRDSMSLDVVPIAEIDSRIINAKNSLIILKLRQIEIEGVRTLIADVLPKEHTVHDSENSAQAITDSVHRWGDTVFKQAECDRAKQQMELLQLDKIQYRIKRHVIWLQRQTAEVASTCHPSGVTMANAKADYERIEDRLAALLSEGQTKLRQLFAEQAPCETFGGGGLQKLIALEKYATDTSTDVITDCANALTRPLHDPHKLLFDCHLQLVSLIKLIKQDWQHHLSCLSEVDRLVQTSELFLEVARSTLSSIHPSKLVIKCKQQVTEVEELLKQLKNHEATVTELYSLPLPKWFKATSCSAKVPFVELLQVSATLRSLRHNFVCLYSRASERRRILYQALHEDETFDSAYKRLIGILQSQDMDCAGDGREDELQLVVNQERPAYLSTLRLGSNLRDRCTQSDPERGIIESMLVNLGSQWSTCLQSITDRQLRKEKRLLEFGELRRATQRLVTWIKQCEVTLAIGEPNGTSPRPPLSAVETGDTEYTLDGQQLKGLGFDMAGLLALTSVAGGDETLLWAQSADHQILVSDLKRHQQIWKTAGLPQEHRTVASSWSVFDRMDRLHIACCIKAAAIEWAKIKHTELKSWHQQLTNWMDSVEQLYRDVLPTERRSEYGLRTVPIHEAVASGLQTRGEGLQLDSMRTEYSRLRLLQVQLEEGCLVAYTALVHKLIGTEDPKAEPQKAENGLTVAIPEVGRIALSVHAHSSGRKGLAKQQQSLIERWVQSNVYLNLFHEHMSQLMPTSAQRIQLDEVEQQTSRLTAALHIQLTKQGALFYDWLKLVRGENSLEKFGEPPFTPAQLEELGLMIIRELGDPISQGVRIEGSTLETMLTEVDSNTSKAKCFQAAVLDCAKLAHSSLSHFRGRCQGNSGVNGANLDTSRRESSTSNSLPNRTWRRTWSEVIEPNTVMAKSQCLWQATNCPRSVSICSALPVVGGSHSSMTSSVSQSQMDSAQCKRVQKAITYLTQHSDKWVTVLERLGETLSQYFQVHDFDFEQWRKNCSHWLSTRHFRLIDLFRNPNGSSLASRTASYTSLEPHCDKLSHSNLSINRDNEGHTSSGVGHRKSLAFGNHTNRFKKDTSLEHLGVLDDHLENKGGSMTLNCEQFVQAIQRYGPEFVESSSIELKAAFHAIDTKKTGNITYQQLSEALRPERKRESLPIGVLISQAIKEETDKCTCESKFLPVKVADNKFRFGSGNRVYLVRFLNSSIMVRVGGGWMTLTEFVNSRDPCRSNRKVQLSTDRSRVIRISQRPTVNASDRPRLVVPPPNNVPKSGLGSLHCRTSWFRSPEPGSSCSSSSASSQVMKDTKIKLSHKRRNLVNDRQKLMSTTSVERC